MLAQLIPKQGGPPVTLGRPITVVGRSSRLCDFVIDHSSISKQHCMLIKTDGLVYMRDLGSTNGTRVNGQRVIRGALLPGDMISFASITYRIHLGPDVASGGPRQVSSRSSTEMMPLLPHELNDEDLTDPVGGSKSDVRLLRDSDLLMPD